MTTNTDATKVNGSVKKVRLRFIVGMRSMLSGQICGTCKSRKSTPTSASGAYNNIVLCDWQDLLNPSRMLLNLVTQKQRKTDLRG